MGVSSLDFWFRSASGSASWAGVAWLAARLEFARLGYTVKEMLGGFEYWAREGWAVETGIGAITRRSVDPLTGPVSGISCAC